MKGRVAPEQPASYVKRLSQGPREDRVHFRKNVCVLQFFYRTNLERTGFDALHGYLTNKKRWASVQLSSSAFFKDFYILPMRQNETTPRILEPLSVEGKCVCVCVCL